MSKQKVQSIIKIENNDSQNPNIKKEEKGFQHIADIVRDLAINAQSPSHRDAFNAVLEVIENPKFNDFNRFNIKIKR